MDLLELDNNNANSSILLLRANTRKMISNLLNPAKLLRTEQGLLRDWQGLAELCGISGELIPSISIDRDPTSKVLKMWHEKAKADATIGKLLDFLEQIDRTDIVDDVSPLVVIQSKFVVWGRDTNRLFMVERDASTRNLAATLKKFIGIDGALLSKVRRRVTLLVSVKVVYVHGNLKKLTIFGKRQCVLAEDLKYHKEHPISEKSFEPFDLEADKHILTRDDVIRINEGLEPQRYDAFVLFADDDIDFATELIENMEKNYNLKFCVKERDLVVGGSEHEAVIKLITERCGRLIVIISPAFLESNANKFFYSLAQSIAIEQRERKIIPCIYKECGTLPPELSCYFKLDFRRTGALWNFWDRLHDSIKMPQYKPKMKLSLPENSLFRREDITSHLKVGNTVSRSVSNPNELLSPNDLKSALHKDSSGSHHISHSVKFSSSMSNLPTADVPEDNMVPSTSANSLGKYQETGVRKTMSIYKKLKNLVSKPKSKTDKISAKSDKTSETEVKQNGKIPKDSEKSNSKKPEEKEVNEIEKERKGEKKEKKKLFTLRKNKKKAVLADT